MQQLEISIDGERVGLYTLPGIGGAADRLLRVPDQHRMPALPRTRASNPGSRNAGTADPSCDLSDSAGRTPGSPRKSRARSSGRKVESARARQGWRARSRRHVPQQRLGARRNAAAARSAALPGGRQHPRDASRRATCAASRWPVHTSRVGRARARAASGSSPVRTELGRRAESHARGQS